MEEREFMKERMKELRGQLKDFILDQRDKKREIARLTSRVAELEAALTAGYEVLLYQSLKGKQAREWLPKDYAVIDAIAALLANAPNAAQVVDAAHAAWWAGNVVAVRASDALAAKADATPPGE